MIFYLPVPQIKTFNQSGVIIPVFRRHLVLFLAALFFLLPSSLVAKTQNRAVPSLGPGLYHRKNVQRIQDEFLLNKDWRYHNGDDITWSDPAFDDSSWVITESRIPPKHFPDDGWKGIGWFRKWVEVPETDETVPTGMMILFSGAAEVYIDGEKVFAAGTVSKHERQEEPVHHFRPNSVPLHLESGKHLIAVRFSNWHADRYFTRANNNTGFHLWFGEETVVSLLATYRIKILAKYLYFFTGAALAFALLHLLLYLYYPAERGNLYYALHTFGIAMVTYVGFSTNFVDDPTRFFVYFTLFKLAALLMIVYALRFAYAVFYDRTPMIFRIFVITAILLGITAPFNSLLVIYVFVLASFVEMLRAVFISVHRRRTGARVVALGLFAMVATVSLQIFSSLRLINPIFEQQNIYLYGMMTFLVSMSIILARNSARTKNILRTQVVQVRELSNRALEQERFAKEQEVEKLRLEAENERQHRELEIAHERQHMIERLEQANCDLEAANLHLRNTQAQLVQSEKMASLGSLVAGIAHEINTPIGAVRSMHDTLIRGVKKLNEYVESSCEKDSDDYQKIQKILGIVDDSNRVIDNGVQRVTTIVQRLRSFARLDEAELKKASIEAGLDDTLMLIHHEIKHTIKIERDYGDVGEISCFPSQLNQVFLNILNNARQAMPDGGTITLKTERNEKLITITISDTGTGIPEEHLAHIFDPGFTTKGVRVGTGLGLSITYKIIEDHHGSVDVESTERKGTTFRISLPVNLEEMIDHT